MGNTVILDQKVLSFDTKVDGQYIYFLYEQTYEKNVYPHTPNWSIRKIGNYDQCWEFITWCASHSESGGSETKSGAWISPLDVVSSWRKAFRDVGRLDSTEFRVQFGGGVYKVDPAFREHFENVFRKFGVDFEASKKYDLKNESVLKAVLNLFHEPLKIKQEGSYWPLSYAIYAVLADIPSERGNEFPLFEANVDHQNQASNLLETLDVEAFYLNKNKAYKILLVDGELFAFGEDYRVISPFLLKYAVKHETERHGSFHDLYRKFKEILDTASALPANSLITLTRPAPEAGKWVIGDYDECAAIAEPVSDGAVSIDAERLVDFYPLARFPIEMMKLFVDRSSVPIVLTAAKQISLLA